MNGPDESSGTSGGIECRLCLLMHDADLAVRAQDAIFEFHWLAMLPHGAIQFDDTRPIIRMDMLQVLGIGPGSAAWLQSENAPAFVGPDHFVCFEVELPAPDMTDALCLDKASVPLPELIVRQASLDGTGNQCSRRLQQVDFHLVPNPFGTAVVEPERSPQGSIGENGNRKHRVCVSFLEQLSGFTLGLRERHLDNFAAQASLEPVIELRSWDCENRIILIARVV